MSARGILGSLCILVAGLFVGIIVGKLDIALEFAAVVISGIAGVWLIGGAE